MELGQFINVEFFEMLFQGIVAFLVLLFLIVLTYVVYRHFAKTDEEKEVEAEE